GEYRGMPGHSHAGSLRPYRAACRHDAATTSALDDEIGDLAVLYDIHAKAACSARITPGHGIVPGGATAGLPGAAIDRKACRRREIVDGHDAPHIIHGEKLAVDPVDLNGIDRAGRRFHRLLAVREREDAPG